MPEPHPRPPTQIRRLLLPEGVNGIYHVVSRIVDRSMKLGDEEKQCFIHLMHNYANFCGVRLLSWVVMSNHFHLLVEVPPVDRENMPANEVFRRLEFIWSDSLMHEARANYAACKTEEKKRAFLDNITYRMGDLRHYMKALKQQFTMRFNKANERTGTLWEGRYHSVIVEGEVPVENPSEDGSTQEESGYEIMSHAARIVAAYIDLNPVRAGIVQDPADYRWSSYGAAVAGDAIARAGMARLWTRSTKSALAAHRLLIFEEGSEDCVPNQGEKSKRVGIARAKVREVVRQRGKLPLAQILCVRVRYMTAGGILGSRAFVRQVYAGTKESSGAKRHHISVPMRYGEWGGLHTFRNLSKDIIG